MVRPDGDVPECRQDDSSRRVRQAATRARLLGRTLVARPVAEDGRRGGARVPTAP